MKLSRRLGAIAAYIPDGAAVADICLLYTSRSRGKSDSAGPGITDRDWLQCAGRCV